MKVYALVEAGGTKFVCAVADEQNQLIATERIETQDPLPTLSAAREFFANLASDGHSFAAGGIASFGPIDLDAASPTYGQIRRTPKPGWSGIDIRAALPSITPIGLDTDVNAAGLAEALWGAGVGHATVAYATIGTGIGVGIVRDGVVLAGATHSEIGHIPVKRDRIADPFEGCCPYHGDCLEGLACGPAIKKRWGLDLLLLPPHHPAFDIQANYIAQLCVSLIYSFAPHVIILGGGVMQTPGLLSKIRHYTVRLLGNYWTAASHQGDLRNYLVPPALDNSGLRGALALAAAAKARYGIS
jgi:fructokinase